MDESVLRRALASLDARNSSLHWWFEFWTLLVVFGVVLDVLFVAWEYLDELHDFRRGFIHPPEKPRAVLFALGLLGAALVATGVSGEFWKESQISTAETCMRKGNDTLFLLLSKEAGSAAAAAANARKEADAAKGVAGLANKLAGEATLSAAKVQGEASNAFTLAKSAHDMVAWRTVSAKQEDELKAFLFPLTGRGVTVSWETNEPEQNAFATQLIAALRAAGLSVAQQPASLIAYDDTALGIVVAGDRNNPLTVGLGWAFVCSGLTNAPDILPATDAKSVAIEIKAKDPIKRPIPAICKKLSPKP